MLDSAKLMAFVTIADPAKAKAFYQDVLGLKLLSEDNFALVFDAQGTTLRVAIAPSVTIAPYTVLGWQVKDIQATAVALTNKGIQFERYPWMSQDDLGIWTAPSDARVAWFKDPEGNLLSLSQH